MKTRYFSIFLAVILMSTMLAGCGSKDAAATTESAPNSSSQTEYEGEGQTQGGIKSDEEIAALQEEESSYEEEAETEYAENVDNTGHEPESYGSGNFQDYWQGEDYFDLAGYLKDNGAIDAYPSDFHYEKVDGPAELYVSYTKDYAWRLVIYTSNNSGGIFLSWFNYMQAPYDKDGPTYMVVPKESERTMVGNFKEITVDTHGNTMADYTLENLAIIIQALQENQDSKDPLANYTDLLTYSNYDL